MLQRYRMRNRQVYSKGARTQRVLTKPSELVPPLQQRAPPFACVAAAAVGVRKRAHRVRDGAQQQQVRRELHRGRAKPERKSHGARTAECARRILGGQNVDILAAGYAARDEGGDHEGVRLHDV